MKITILSPTHVREDERGTFLELVNDQTVRNISYGSMRKGAVMGNHYHKKTSVYFFLTLGHATVTNLDVRSGERATFDLQKNQGTMFKPFITHAIAFKEDSTFILLKTKPYSEKNSDTFKHIV